MTVSNTGGHQWFAPSGETYNLTMEKGTYNNGHFQLYEYVIEERDHLGARRELYRDYYV